MADEASASIFTLSDGRQLCYADHASPDLGAATPTVFYFHGFPGSRLEAAIAAPHARALGCRIIAPDRPGMGLSTHQPGRTFADWPKDVAELADHLQIARFFVLCASGGSPYVLACARYMSERLLGAGIVAGVYPFRLGSEGMPMATRILLWTAGSDWLRGGVTMLLDWFMGGLARDTAHPERLEQSFMKEMQDKHDRDVRCLDDLTLRKQVIDATREAFRKDSVGVAWEAGMVGRDWGFELEEVNFEGLQMWHGRLDGNVPVAMAERAAELIRGAKLRVVEDEAHLSLPVHHLEEILESLVSIGQSGNATL